MDMSAFINADFELFDSQKKLTFEDFDPQNRKTSFEFAPSLYDVEPNVFFSASTATYGN